MLPLNSVFHLPKDGLSLLCHLQSVPRYLSLCSVRLSLLTLLFLTGNPLKTRGAHVVRRVVGPEPDNILIWSFLSDTSQSVCVYQWPYPKQRVFVGMPGLYFYHLHNHGPLCQRRYPSRVCANDKSFGRHTSLTELGRPFVEHSLSYDGL